MRILCFTDNHFCENYSIVKRYGTTYSVRLENQLESLNWLEKTAVDLGCEAIFCLGDFFDRPELNEKEITAVKDIKWSNIPHYFLVGNHESSVSDLQYSSTKILEGDNRFVISSPQIITLGGVDFCMLPYVVESDRKDLGTYFTEERNKPRIIFSHNDLRGIQMGPVVSKTGFGIEEIEANCDLFINGHLHNGQKITNKILNLGNFTGKDFGEDATRYAHNALLLDTETSEIKFIENPHAFNFYKLDINTEADLNRFELGLKNQAVVSIKCKEALIEGVRKTICESSKIVEARVVIAKDEVMMSDGEVDISDLTLDHLEKFVECCKEKIDNSDILDFELAEICR
jgi:DNA repair exonuclease SbcCD nuclease subunit